MRKEELIKKWLDNELSPEEMKSFRGLEEYESINKIVSYASSFGKEFEPQESVYASISDEISQRKIANKKRLLIINLTKIAAVIVFGLFVFNLFFSKELSNFETLTAEKENIVLPDNSEVRLNALSQLSYNVGKWNEHRTVKLNGEAFFKVNKGSKFKVQTEAGTVSVLGTEFNVLQRPNYFEVTCYEGSVLVSSSQGSITLRASDSFRLLNGKITSTTMNDSTPSWTANVSTFKSVPLSFVIAELQRQFNIKVTGEVDQNQLFTGRFSHLELDLALKSITLPLNLGYRIEANTVTLFKIE